MNSILYLLSNSFNNKIKFNKLLSNSDFVVAVDGGLNIAKENKLLNKVIYAIGDFDTCVNPQDFIQKEKIIKYPPKKDRTDTVLAFNFLKDKKEFSDMKHIFFSVSGAREDHFLSLIFYFLKERLYNISKFELHNDNESIFLLKGGKYKILKQNKRLFSFLPLSKIENLTIKPIEYPFPSNLPAFFDIGVSNTFDSDTVELSFSGESAILFIENKDGNKIEILNEIY